MKNKRFRKVILASIIACSIPVTLVSATEVKTEGFGVTLDPKKETVYDGDTIEANTENASPIDVEEVKEDKGEPVIKDKIADRGERLNLSNKVVTIMAKEDGLYLINNGSESKLDEAKAKKLLDNLSYSIEDDIVKSYNDLMSDNLSSDHLKLEYWGEFLYLYADKQISSMPNSDYILELNNGNKVTFKGDRNTRIWIADNLIPLAKNVINYCSNKYILNVYKYIPSDTVYLVDFNYDSLTDESNTAKDYSVHPFLGIVREDKEDNSSIELSVHSVGEKYGLQLHRDYVSVISNTNTESGCFISTPFDTNGCISKTLLFGVPKNESEEVITNPKQSDYMGVEDLALDLSDNSIVKMTSIDGYKIEKVGLLEDFNLTVDTIAVKKVSDGAVVVPLLFEERFQTSEKSYPNGFTVDLTPVIFQGVSEVKVGEDMTESLERYVGSNGTVDVRLNDKNQFYILNGMGKTHYGRMSIWIWSGQADEWLSDANQVRYIEIAEKWYKDNKLGSEWSKLKRKYDTNSADSSNLLPIALVGGLVLVCGGVAGGLIFSKKKKTKANDKATGDGLAFGFDDEEDDDEDDGLGL